MKTQELRNLIREEVRKVLKEAKEASKQLSWNAIKPGDKITYVVPGSSNKTATGKVVSKDSTRTEDFLIVIDDKTKKKMNIMMSHVGSVNENSVQFKESILKEADIPQNITDFAKRKGVLPVVKQVASWAKKSGKKIRGGTAIGKDYGTLILDLTYQGGEIRINTNTEEIEVNGESVSDYADFKQAIA